MNSTTKAKGFTIIEVVLVLAIAALIFLMIFIAWPALQRSQRDTSRKDESAAMSAAVASFRSDNNGGNPTTAANITDYTGSIANNQLSSVTIGASANPVVATGATTSNAQITFTAKCTSAGAASSTGATARDFVVQYRIEAGGTPILVCLQG